MSNYRALAWHPMDRDLQVAEWLEDWFEPGVYGVRFEGTHTWAEHAVTQPDAVDLFLIAQEMAEAGEKVRNAENGRGSLVEAWSAYGTALAKWRDFTNAKEKTDG